MQKRVIIRGKNGVCVLELTPEGLVASGEQEICSVVKELLEVLPLNVVVSFVNSRDGANLRDILNLISVWH